MTDFGNVAVLMGGSSREREISLQSGTAVLNALVRKGIQAEAFDPAYQDCLELKKFDRAFICLHGKMGEDGVIQGMLEMLNIPYTGSGVSASSLGMDKWRTKIIWQAMKINTPKFMPLTEKIAVDKVVKNLGLPLMVKPVREGSSYGITKVTKLDDMLSAYKIAKDFDEEVIAEAYITGREYSVSILKEMVLPIVEIRYQSEFYDFSAKYERNDTKYLIEQGLPHALVQNIQKDALSAFQSLGAVGWGRVDFLLDEQGNYYFLEVNTCPGMTSHSLFPMSAKAIGLDFDNLAVEILKDTVPLHN